MAETTHSMPQKGMESKNGSPNQKFQQSSDSLKDFKMEDLVTVDPELNSEENCSTFMHRSFFRNTFSSDTFNLSTIQDFRMRIQERAKNVKSSVVITFIIILAIIVIFSIPVILYYALKTDRLELESNSVFTDVNISVNPLFGCPSISIISSECTQDVIYTYESLKVASVFTNQFCPNRTYPLFCKALEHCSNGQEDIVRDLLCTQVRQKLCAAEWRILEVNNRSEEMINCQRFGETSQPNCTKQFNLADNNSVCLPLCEEFSEYGEKFTDFIAALSAIVHLVNVIGGIIVIVACIWNRTKMFKFPEILTPLNTCMLTSVSFIIMLSKISMGSWNPLCSQRFLIGHLNIVGALDEPSTFCQIQGMIVFAGFVMYSVYWLLYAFHLYMKVAQPEYSMLLDSWHRTIKFYYLEVGLVTIIGTVPYIVLAGLSEFDISQFPPQFCTISVVGNFYGFVFPTVIVNCATVIILLLLLRHVHISKNSWQCQITTTEMRIFLTFCYLLAFFVLLWTSNTYDLSRHYKSTSNIRTYFRCLANGVHDQLDCEQYRREFENLSIPWLVTLHRISITFLNVSNLPLIIEYKRVKEVLCHRTVKLMGSSAT